MSVCSRTVSYTHLEVRFHHAVLLIQVFHDRKFDLLAAFLVHGLARHRADQHVQALAFNNLGRLFGHLLRGQMGQQIGDDEPGVLRLVADAHLDCFHLPVVANAHHAAQLDVYKRQHIDRATEAVRLQIPQRRNLLPP